jgi:uncharacterized protein (DUF924 family)
MTGEGSRTVEPEWVGNVIRFWLEETPPEARFKRDDALDTAIANRFGAIYERLSIAPPEVSGLTPRTALAALIVLDQFPRNMFRGTSRAFASDSAALRIAQAAVDAGHDKALDKYGRLFVYLPFEHSENLADQDKSVALIADLGDADLDRYAIAHRDIVRRFGRFPHRNAALGRVSTPEESEFLEQPGSSF